MPIHPTDVLARYNRAISVPHAMGIDYSELLRDMAAEIEQHRTVSACRDAGTMESAVAAAARAICKERFLNGGVDTDDGWDSATPEIQGDCLKQARAALTAGVITAITSELIGSVEQERLAKTPWARSLVNDLIRRIANLRAMLAAEHTGQPQEGEVERLREAMQDACDLLAERTWASLARSASSALALASRAPPWR